jgi:Asp-tRNA(Asn)/Glu-tRNA(Gln) amidotransferase A subunit family amidase
MRLNELSATEAAARIASGDVSSEDLMRACLARIAEREPSVRAFAHVAAESAIRAARDADTAVLLKDKDRPLRPLHGVPFAVKDIIETVEMPTEYNSRIYRGHQSGKDAACVTLLRSAGAIVIGKAETIEFAAHGRLPVTRNPHDLTRTPGGSSSGSAAAVADMMVPLSLGTQTGGSVIRPASYCGVFGFKPTWGAISAEGAKLFSVTLDTIGWYGRAIEDIVLLAKVYEISSAEEPVLKGLNLAYCDTPYWSRATADGQSAFRATLDKLRAAGATVTELKLGEDFSAINDLKERVMRGEGRVAFLNLHHKAPDKLSPGIRARMGRTDDLLLRKALDDAAMLRIAFDRMAEPFDAVLTPAATGVAPEGIAYAGDPIFNGLWTLLHVPCLSMPVMTGEKGLPIGLQLVGPRYADARVIAAGRGILKRLAAA